MASATKHTINKDVFHSELTKRGWDLHGPSNTWVAPPGSTRIKMEQDWLECLLLAIHCPHEEAGVE